MSIENEVTKVEQQAAAVEQTVQADVAKVKSFWQKYGPYVAAVAAVLGFAVGKL